MEKFDLEFQWLQYLAAAGLSLEKMHPVQIIETKRAFVAGLAQMFTLFTEDKAEMGLVEALDGLYKQIGRFWEAETFEDGV